MASQSKREFAQRLKDACDRHPNAPDSWGRQAWLAREMGASQEAARKWFNGESKPRVEMLRKLAEFLNVDEGWLSFGLNPGKSPQKRKALQRRAAGAIYYVAGQIEMQQGRIAFPEKPGDKPGVDIHAIIDGHQRNFHVAMADRTSPGHYQAIVPSDYRDMLVLVVVPTRAMCPPVLFLPPDMLDRYATHHGGYAEVELIADDGQFLSGEETWPVVTSYAEMAEPPAEPDLAESTA